MNCYLLKNNKIKFGYSNAAIYNFNNKSVYVVNKALAQKLLIQPLSDLSNKIVEKLLQENIITTDSTEQELNPLNFQYELFDDKYSYEKCKIVYLEVTDTCNFNCLHCYADIKNDSANFMSLNAVQNYIDDIAKSGSCNIRITGGEPFLNKDICRIVDCVTETIAPLSTHSIVSNGSFDIEDALYILEKGFELQISIYGVDSGKFCNFTKSTPQKYNKILENLSILSNSKYKNQIVLLFSVNSITYADIETFKKLTQNLGFRYILNRPASVGRAVQNWEQLKLPYKELVEFAKSQKASTPFYCYHLCQLHWTSVMVNGDITPCGFLRNQENVIGNLKTDSFKNIWENKRYNTFRKLNANDVQFCKDCEFEFVCTAGCCGETAAYTGNILNVFSWCQLKPYSNKDYLIIDENELYLTTKNAAGLFDFTIK